MGDETRESAPRRDTGRLVLCEVQSSLVQDMARTGESVSGEAIRRMYWKRLAI